MAVAFFGSQTRLWGSDGAVKPMSQTFPNTEPVTFYLPYRQDGFADVPRQMDDYWPWISGNRRIGEGKYSWTLQTYLQLKEAGLPCRLAHRFPRRGIVVSHRDFLPVYLLPRTRVFLVCIKPDRKEHTWAHYYIVQNGRDAIVRSPRGRNRTTTMLHWPQPSLLPRTPDRGDRCENVAYFGRTLNLADELKKDGWTVALRGLGFNWSTVRIENWNDYRDVDITVSVRSFGSRPCSADPVLSSDSKPPTKVINSWLAGIPAVVGAESAYQGIRQSPLDFIEVGTPAELENALVELRRNRDLYRAMAAHGLRRAEEYSVAAVSRRWQDVFRTDIQACYARWCRLSRAKRANEGVQGLVAYFAKAQHWRDLLTIFKSSNSM